VIIALNGNLLRSELRAENLGANKYRNREIGSRFAQVLAVLAEWPERASRDCKDSTRRTFEINAVESKRNDLNAQNEETAYMENTRVL
jgi:hypothetical protein